MTIVDQLVEEEGLRLQAYQDSRGFWTIGIGRLIDPSVKGSGLSEEEARYLLANDITECRRLLDANLPWWRDEGDVRQRVLISMAFNLGMGGLLKFKNTLAAFHRRDYTAAAAGMRKSLWAKQVGVRAERLARMMETGRDVTMAEVRADRRANP